MTEKNRVRADEIVRWMRGIRADVVGQRFTDPALRFSWPVAIGFATLGFAINYPGRLNVDAQASLYMASSIGDMGNWHSPALAWLWSLPGAISGQPAGALLIQIMVFGAYAGFLSCAVPGWRGLVSRTLEFAWRFMLTGTFGMIGKDIMLLGLVLIAVQLTCQGLRHPLDFSRGAALVAVLGMTLLIKAPNFLLYVFCAALILPFVVRSWRGYGAIMLAGLIVAPLTVPALRFVDRKVFVARDLHPDKQIVLFDLAGLSVATGLDQFAQVPGWPARTLPPVGSCFLPYQWDGFARWKSPRCAVYADAFDRFDLSLTRRWAGAILSHPVAYLRHRWTYAGYLVTTRKHETWGAGGYALNRAEPAHIVRIARVIAARHRYQRPIQQYRDEIGVMPARWMEWRLFRTPAAQAVATFGPLPLLALLWIRRRRSIRLGAILPAGLAIGNLAMLFFFGVSDEGRYLLPGMALFYVALLALLAPPSPLECKAGGTDPSIGTAR